MAEIKSESGTKPEEKSIAVKEDVQPKEDIQPKEEKVEKTQEKPLAEKPFESKEPKKEKKGKKDKDKVDIVSETLYTVPFRSAHLSKPHFKRTSKAVSFLISYLERHTKSDNIKISSELNQLIWARGPSKPPRRVQIKAIKDSEGKVIAAPL
jgi:large subunit ribosomal protein L31e